MRRLLQALAPLGVVFALWPAALALAAQEGETKAIEVMPADEVEAAIVDNDAEIDLGSESDADALESANDGDVIDLGEIEAVSTRSLAGRFGGRAALDVIELADGQAGQSLPALLETLPGVDVRQSGGTGQLCTAQIRGARGNQVLVLLDGQLLAPGQTADLSQASTASLERVELLRGAAAVRFGPGALGGVINLVTRRGEAGQGAASEGMDVPLSDSFSDRLKQDFPAEPAEGTVSLSAGSFGYGASDLVWEHGAFAGGVSYSRARNDYRFRRRGGETANRLNNETQRLGAWASGSRGQDWRLSLSSIERGEPGSAEFPTLEATYSRDAAYLTLGSPGEALRGGISLSRESFVDPRPYLGTLPVNNSADRLQISLSGGQLVAAPGVGWTAVLDGVDSSEYGQHNRGSVSAAWSGERQLGGGLLAGSASLALDNDGLLPPSASLSLSRPLGQGASVYVSTGYRYRRPDFEELYATGLGSLQGNPELNPESCASLEVGALLGGAHSSFQCALFADKYYDSILFVPASAYLVRASNTGRASVAGAEAGWESCAGPLDFRSSLTWLPIAEFDSGIPLVGRSRMHSSSRLAYRYRGMARPGSYLAATLDYTGSMTGDLFGNLRIPPRTIAGLELGAELHCARLSFGVNNILDRQARDVWNYPLPGREYRFSMSMDL